MIDILLRYLGIKTKLLDAIDTTICEEITGGCILDLFSGSTIVAQKMMNRYTVYTNDIQRYSYVVSKALVEMDPAFDYASLDVQKIIRSAHFQANNAWLTKLWAKPLAYEVNLIQAVSHDLDNEALLQQFKTYYEKAPYVFDYQEDRVPECFQNMGELYSIEAYSRLQENKSGSYYMLFTLNYAMPYFSLSQAVFIDSYRYALDKLLEEGEICETEFHIYLSLLIYLLNNIVTSVGDHFAQPQKFKVSEEKKLKREIEKILRKKKLHIQQCLEEKCAEFRRIQPQGTFANKSFCRDYREVLQDVAVKKHVDLVYIDPPYTNAHYSRFYHILETLVRYDYPTLEYFGRYRNDRFQSPFCIRSEAIAEFEHMIGTCAHMGKILVISYSDTKQCIVTKEQLLQICNQHYKTVKVKEHGYLYRNFGQKPNKVKGNELLIVCR